MTINLMGQKGVTIFSDASVFHSKKRSGYGVWAKGDGREPLIVSGKIDPFEPRVSTCELIGLYAGLAAVCKAYILPTDNYVLLQSDSTDALCNLRDHANGINHPHPNSAPLRRYTKKSKRDRDGAKYIRELCTEHNVTLYIRHARGHNSGGGRNYVNRLVDNLAKDAAMS